MSGWIHTCLNGHKLLVRHGDMSGYVEVQQFQDGDFIQAIHIPGYDILKLVADFARSEQISAAEAEIDAKTPEQILGIRELPGPPHDLAKGTDA